jgi:hypothetical protein
VFQLKRRVERRVELLVLQLERRVERRPWHKSSGGVASRSGGSFLSRFNAVDLSPHRLVVESLGLSRNGCELLEGLVKGRRLAGDALNSAQQVGAPIACGVHQRECVCAGQVAGDQVKGQQTAYGLMMDRYRSDEVATAAARTAALDYAASKANAMKAQWAGTAAARWCAAAAR